MRTLKRRILHKSLRIARKLLKGLDNSKLIKIDLIHSRASLPSLSGEYRIIIVSDIHPNNNSDIFEKIVEPINASSPDFVFFTGDILDRRGTESYIDKFAAIEANISKIAVSGNWEYKSGLDLRKLKDAYEKAGYIFLINSWTEYPDFVVAGLDDRVHYRQDYSFLSNFENLSKPILLLSHRPMVFDFLKNYKLPECIVFSGHTHGGQIKILGKVLYTPFGSSSYVHGWYKNNIHRLCLTTGVGASRRLPIRIGVKPEILVVDLVKKENY